MNPIKISICQASHLGSVAERLVATNDVPDLVAKVVIMAAAFQGLGFLIQAVDGTLLRVDVQLNHL
jgi:hypothetical protein